MRSAPWLAVLWFACSTQTEKEDDDRTDIPTDPHPPTTPTTPTTTTPSTSTGPPPACSLIAPAPYLVDRDDACVNPPVVGTFDPVVAWTWITNPVHPGYHQVVVTPAVINLTDDNGDGAIDELDTPDIVFVGFEGGNYAAGSALTAISGADGSTLWSVLDVGGHHPRGTGGIAAGDLDADGTAEIVVPALEGLLCVDHEGNLEWTSPVAIGASAMPAIGDLDGDGFAEVVVGKVVYEHDGAVRWTGTEGQGGTYNVASFPADLDGDGLQEVLAGNTVYDYDGAVRWFDGLTDGKPAVADFDGDGTPEIVRVYGGGVHLSEADGSVRWSLALTDAGGGAPTVADFDGDTFPEIGVASQAFYRVIDGDGTELWAQPIDDASSALTGSSAFDFEGDGAVDIAYADQHTLWVFEGATGVVKWQFDGHSSGTLHEYPVIADLDRDGSAELIVVSNDYAFAGSAGITVWSDRTQSWLPARPVWNQHAYGLTNVDDDGGIPSVPVPSWSTENTFRAATHTPPPVIPLPDLAVGAPEVCLDECDADRVWAWFPVENRGEAPASGTLTVTRADLTPLADLPVPVVAAGGSVWVGPVALSSADFDGVIAAVTSTDPECDLTANTWIWDTFPCP